MAVITTKFLLLLLLLLSSLLSVYSLLSLLLFSSYFRYLGYGSAFGEKYGNADRVEVACAALVRHGYSYIGKVRFFFS